MQLRQTISSRYTCCIDFYFAQNRANTFFALTWHDISACRVYLNRTALVFCFPTSSNQSCQKDNIARSEKSNKDMASSRNLVTTIGALASSKMGDVLCWHATPVANAPWKPLIIGEGQARYQGHEIGGKSDWLGSHCWSRIRMSFNIRERDTSYCWIRSPYRP